MEEKLTAFLDKVDELRRSLAELNASKTQVLTVMSTSENGADNPSFTVLVESQTPIYGFKYAGLAYPYRRYEKEYKGVKVILLREM